AAPRTFLPARLFVMPMTLFIRLDCMAAGATDPAALKTDEMAPQTPEPACAADCCCGVDAAPVGATVLGVPPSEKTAVFIGSVVAGATALGVGGAAACCCIWAAVTCSSVGAVDVEVSGGVVSSDVTIPDVSSWPMPNPSIAPNGTLR